MPQTFACDPQVLEPLIRLTSSLAAARSAAEVARCAVEVLGEMGFGPVGVFRAARDGAAPEPVAASPGAEIPLPDPEADSGADPAGPDRVRYRTPARSHDRAVGWVVAEGPEAPWAGSAVRVVADCVALAFENEALHEANEARVRQLLAVQRVGREMTSTLDLERLLRMVVGEAAGLTGADAGAVYLRVPGSERLALAAWTGRQPARREVEVGYGIPGWVAREGRPLRVVDRGRPDAPVAERRNHLAVPLLSEGETLGVLALEARGPNPFTPTHEEILSIFAAQAAKAIEATQFFRQIREERDLRDAILSVTPNGVVALDARRRVVLMNPAARRLLEVREPPEGNPVERYLGPAPVLEALGRIVEGDSDLEQVPVDLGSGPGLRHLLVSMVPMGEAPPRGATVIVQDLTERRRLDERVQRMARLASIGQLAAGIAHEIRNPLTGMAISLDVLAEEPGLGEGGRGLVADMHAEIDRLEALIRGLLDFARPQPVEARPMRMAKALEWHRTFEKQCGRKGVRFALDLGPNPKIQGDPEKLKQLFLNLAINALEVTPEGGEIRIGVARAGDDWVRVTVEDTGPGMDAETLSHAFDPFFTTKNEGTGLGLSIAHSIVEQHGGRIDVESEPGRGTRFTVDLPAHGAAAGREGGD
ncbi:ATP-binding protein [Deferrisoma sp.]